MPLTSISSNFPSLVIDGRYNNYDANTGDNSSQMLSNYRLNGEKTFFLPATHSSLPWNRCMILCILRCRYASTPSCCSSGLNDFHLLFQRVMEGYVQSALQVPKCGNSALNFSWQREVHWVWHSHTDFPLIINNICHY